MNDKTSLIKIEAAQHVVLHKPIAEVWEAVNANSGGGEIVTANSTAIKLGNGGYNIHDAEGEVELKDVPGLIIVDHHDARSYYLTGMEEGVTTKAECFSTDGNLGTKYGPCKACRYAQFGSAKNGVAQACKHYKILYVLREQNVLPEVLRLPPTSLTAATEYFMRLSMKGLPHFAVVTHVGTEKARNSAGITYLKATLSLVHRLPPEQVQVMREYAQKFRARRLSVTGGDEPPDWVTAE